LITNKNPVALLCVFWRHDNTADTKNNKQSHEFFLKILPILLDIIKEHAYFSHRMGELSANNKSQD